MARPLRIDLAGAWYHVMNRGHRGGKLFLNDTDWRRFLGAVAELPDRFGLEIHAFVLMINHYHLLVRTTEPNLSHAIRWLNVVYAVKFNWAHRTHGTVFQGRFKAVLIQEEGKAVEVARYIHLNPVRVRGLGLSKSDQRQARVVGCENPKGELIGQRLEVLREYRWNSWRIYMGLESNPGWLDTSVVGRRCGGRSRAERMAALKAYTEQPIRQGVLTSPWEGLVGGVILGEKVYAQSLLRGRKLNEEEQTAARRMRRRVEWMELVRMAEKLKGEKWENWAGRYGDWGRDGLMYVAVRYGGLRLAEIVPQAVIKYQAAAQAVKRFGQRLDEGPDRKRFVSELRRQMSTI